MDVKLLNDFEHFLGLREEWDRLLLKSSNESVYLTHEWLSSWWKGFGKKNELMVMLAIENERILGAAPLMVGSGTVLGFPIKKVAFMGDAAWTIGDFIVTEDKARILGAILERVYSENWDIVDLRCIPETSENLMIIKEILKSKSIRFTECPASIYPCLSVDMPWEDFYKERSVKFKKVIRNKLNRINKAGEVRLRRYSSSEEIAEVLPIVFEIGLKGWKHTINNSISSTDSNKTFYSSLAGVMSSKGLIDIWLLSLNGTPVAFEYHLRYNNRVYGLTTDFDESFRELSPGSVLDFLIVEYLFRNEICEYDMGSGTSFYKEHWTDRKGSSVRLSFYRQSLYSNMLLFINSKAIPYARYIKNRFRKIKRTT